MKTPADRARTVNILALRGADEIRRDIELEIREAADEARRDEREECAKVCEAVGMMGDVATVGTASRCAAAIRAREKGGDRG